MKKTKEITEEKTVRTAKKANEPQPCKKESEKASTKNKGSEKTSPQGRDTKKSCSHSKRKQSQKTCAQQTQKICAHHKKSQNACSTSKSCACKKQCTAQSDDAPPLLSEEETRHNFDLGVRGEEAAVRFLCSKGFEILERRWECPGGEADIIARKNNDLHFIEVKTRMSTHNGFPIQAVDRRKRQHYERIAEFYVTKYHGPEGRVLFDIISILVVAEDRAFLKFHQNAYVAGE